MTEPQNEDHKAIWTAIHAQTDSIAALRQEINVNGYMEILKELARRYERRREVWLFFKKPILVATKLGWLLVGALIWGIANHVFGLWPTAGHP